MSLTRLVAARIRSLHLGSVPDSARSRLKLLLLCNISVAVASRSLASVARLLEMARNLPPGKAVVLLQGARTRAQEAAFVNAMLIHARAQDDFHPQAKVHVGASVIPPVLALGQEASASGQTVLEALLAGYTTAVSLGADFSELSTQRGFRPTPLYGALGAAMAAARCLELDEEQMANALGLAASLAGGTAQSWLDGADEWLLHLGGVALHGIIAAHWAAHGVRSSPAALEGTAGFYRAFTGQENVSRRIEARLSDPGAAVLTTSLKRYPVSGICQPLVHVASRLRQVYNFVQHEVESVTVYLHPTELNYPGTRNSPPFRSFSDALMSARYCTASALLDGGIRMSDFCRFDRPERLRLVEKIELRPDPGLPHVGCRVRVKLRGGGEVGEEYDGESSGSFEVGWHDVDDWAIPLWLEGGQTEQQYLEFRKCVESLDDMHDLGFLGLATSLGNQPW